MASLKPEIAPKHVCIAALDLPTLYLLIDAEAGIISSPRARSPNASTIG